MIDIIIIITYLEKKLIIIDPLIVKSFSRRNITIKIIISFLIVNPSLVLFQINYYINLPLTLLSVDLKQDGTNSTLMMTNDGIGESSWAVGKFGWMASETGSFAISDEISPKSTTSFTIETDLY